jgi:hypothetical protein
MVIKQEHPRWTSHVVQSRKLDVEAVGRVENCGATAPGRALV